MERTSEAILRGSSDRVTSALLEERIALGAGAVLFGLLTWAGARVSVPLPFTPVPGSLQTLAVLLSGAALGARAGAASQSAYLLMGFLGLPVFALPGSGPAYFLGPTGGYLLGFVACAFVTGAAFTRLRALGVAGAFLSFLAGSVILYLCGLSWLTVYMGGDPVRAMHAGLTPFLLFDLGKIAIATGLCAGWQRFRRAVFGPWRSATNR